VRAAWWNDQQDEVKDGSLVEPQNQGRAGTTWEPSHEWRLAEGPFYGSSQVSPAGTGLTGGAHRPDRCRSVRLEVGVLLCSLVREVGCLFLGPIALQLLRGLGQLG
jgi:hypothetical protein